MPQVKVRSWFGLEPKITCLRQRHKCKGPQLCLAKCLTQTNALNQTAGQGTSILSIFLASFTRGFYKKAWKSSSYGDPLADVHMKGVTTCLLTQHVNGTCPQEGFMLKLMLRRKGPLHV